MLVQKLMSAEEVYVYKIPPLKGAGGHRAEDWDLAKPLQTCSLLVEQRGEALYLDFMHEGKLFAQSKMDLHGETEFKLNRWLEQVVDSSRYFTLKIQGAGGREATIGFGFRDRERATDLRESLQYYEKSMKREEEAKTLASSFNIPKLKEGERIHANVPGGKKSSTTPKEKDDSRKSKSSGAVPLLMRKPPPPAAEK